MLGNLRLNFLNSIRSKIVKSLSAAGHVEHKLRRSHRSKLLGESFVEMKLTEKKQKIVDAGIDVEGVSNDVVGPDGEGLVHEGISTIFRKKYRGDEVLVNVQMSHAAQKMLHIRELDVKWILGHTVGLGIGNLGRKAGHRRRRGSVGGQKTG